MMMNTALKARSFLPVLLVVLCLISAARLLLDNASSFEKVHDQTDMVTSWDAHMALLHAALPSDITVASYLEGSSLDSSIPGPDVAEFVLTQYALAPVALQEGAEQDWIIGNFGSKLTPAKIKSILEPKLGSYTSQDFGFGIYLIHRIHR